MSQGGSVVSLRAKRRKNWLRQWPIAVVLFGVLIALVTIATDHFRRGAVILSAAVILAFFLRLFLPVKDAGWLAVRSRKVDLIVLGVLGLALAIFSFWVPAPT